MGKNPLNLALRFFLEIAALASMGFWGWNQFDGAFSYVFGLGVPVIAAAAWGIFRVPGDGGQPLVRVPGTIRLLIEVLFFGFAAWCLFDAHAVSTGWLFAGTVVIHYLISYDRIAWLLQQ